MLVFRVRSRGAGYDAAHAQIKSGSITFECVKKFQCACDFSSKAFERNMFMSYCLL